MNYLNDVSLSGSENFIPNISGTTTRSIESSPRIMSPTTVLFLFANSRREVFVMLPAPCNEYNWKFLSLHFSFSESEKEVTIIRLL